MGGAIEVGVTSIYNQTELKIVRRRSQYRGTTIGIFQAG